MTACPSIEALGRGGEQVARHLARCPVCQSIARRLTAERRAGGGDLCARAELLIAVGAATPLSPEDAMFLSSYLTRCSTCRETALEPPPIDDELGVPGVASETYAIGAEIGRGGMGRVITARDRRIGRAVALKELLNAEPAAIARFEREARLTTRLQHPAIVSIYEVGRWPDGRPFYAMPILRGRTLHQAIGEAAGPAERLRLLPSLIAAADAIAYAHSRRIIHRDMTPANILLGAFGETTVIDWGLAKDLDEPVSADDRHGVSRYIGLTAPGTVMGTPAYLAPEQADGGAVDERVDVYALGAILYHLLVGRPPYGDAGPGTVIERLRARQRPERVTPERGVPPELMSVANLAMNPDRGGRYQAASTFVEDLRRYQLGERVRAHTYPGRELASRWLSRHLALVATVSSVLALVGVTATVGSLQVSRERRRADAASLELDIAQRMLANASGVAVESHDDNRRLDEPRNLDFSEPEYRDGLPPGWMRWLTDRRDHVIGIDRQDRHQGRPTAYVRSKPDRTAPGFGTLMQTIAASKHRQQRLRFSALVRTADVAGTAGLWIRAEGGDSVSGPGAFDNMQDRPIQGTTTWRRYEVFVNVPANARAIAFGAFLQGTGAMSFTDPRLEIAPPSSVPVSPSARPAAFP